MSRMVSTRLPTVHKPKIPPIHSNTPLRLLMTSRATGSITSRTELGIATSSALTVAARSLSSPIMEKIAAPVMKNGKIARTAL